MFETRSYCKSPLASLCFGVLMLTIYGIFNFSGKLQYPQSSKEFARILSQLEEDPQSSENDLMQNSSYFLEEREREYKRRKILIETTCQKYKGIFLKDKRCPLLWERKYDISYCPSAKAGTTTWMHHFLMMFNSPELIERWVDEPAKLHVKIKELNEKPQHLSKQEWALLLNRSLKIVFVRHPFVRLVSAFQDKVVDNMKGKKKEYLFVKMLKKNNLWSRKFRTEPEIPTFYEFAELLLLHPELSSHEDHVKHYWIRCNFCHIDYDVIGKIETSKEDTRYVFEKKGLMGKLNFGDKMHASGKKVNKTTEEISLEYFHMLNRSTILGLYERYKIDFEMFGYTVNEYL